MFKEIDQLQPRLADHVYEQIRNAIISGRISPSERIVQDEVASQIKISRTPVREALFRLEKEGVLRKSGRQGFYARQLSEDEVRQIFQGREAVEGFAAKLVAETHTPGQIGAVEKAIDAERLVDREDYVAMFDANRTIHRTVVEQTGNAFLVDMFDSIWNQAISLSLFAASHDRVRVQPGDHDEVLAALKSGAPAMAEEVMIDHIKVGLKNQLKTITTAGESEQAGATSQ